SADKKDAYQTDEAVIEKIKESESQLGNRGRVLVRASGTEPLIRVMLEGENYEEIEQLANGIVDTMKERLC
ncbi:MAG: phosphoglucosamine mutase, partial [Clostridia bacterium]|nr:phosphoglucosamine mutase [Clostridia bacterium]